MDFILESCPGTLGIADDVAVFGRAEIERDANLHNVMLVSRKHGLLFNGKISQIIAARRWSVTSSKPEKQNMNRSRHMCQYDYGEIIVQQDSTTEKLRGVIDSFEHTGAIAMN